MYNIITIRIIHIILAVLVAGLVAGIIAVIAMLFTEDIETIIISCLLGVWIAEVILYIARCKVIFNKRMKTIEKVDTSNIIRKERNLIKIYTVSTIIFAIVLALILYNLEDNLVSQLISGNSIHRTESINDNWLIIKVSIVIILLVILLIRLAVRKKYKNRIVNTNGKQSL